jgi:hypothetical protein
MVVAGTVALATGAQAAPPPASSIDFTTIAPAPTSGTLANGVSWTVDNGVQFTEQGYLIAGGQSQTWTFDKPVTLDFSIAGLNCADERMQVPTTAVPVSINANHIFNATTSVVRNRPAALPTDASEFAINTPVTSFTLKAVGDPTCGRGVTSLSVAYEAPVTETINSPINGATYFQGAPVAADYSCTSDSGDVASCVGNVPDGSLINTATPGVKTFTVTGTNGSGASTSSTVTYTVRALAGACRGTPLSLLTLHGGQANGATFPCKSDLQSVGGLNLVLTPAIPLLHVPANAIQLGLIQGATQTFPLVLPGGSAAQANVANAAISLLGLTITVAGLRSQAGSQLLSCTSPAVLHGDSYIAQLTLNGKALTVLDKPITIPLLGLGNLYLNQTVVVGNTITQRALFLDLPGTALDVVLGESFAGESCV